MIESYGAFGTKAGDVLRALRTLASGSSSLPLPLAEFGAHAVRTIAVALQKGNGMVVRRGVLQSRELEAVSDGEQEE